MEHRSLLAALCPNSRTNRTLKAKLIKYAVKKLVELVWILRELVWGIENTVYQDNRHEP